MSSLKVADEEIPFAQRRCPELWSFTICPTYNSLPTSTVSDLQTAPAGFVRVYFLPPTFCFALFACVVSVEWVWAAA